MVRLISISFFGLVLRSALLRASRRTATSEIVPACHPSRRPREQRGLLRACDFIDFDVLRHESNQALTTRQNAKSRIKSQTLRIRAEVVISTIRYDWLRGIDRLDSRQHKKGHSCFHGFGSAPAIRRFTHSFTAGNCCAEKSASVMMRS